MVDTRLGPAARESRRRRLIAGGCVAAGTAVAVGGVALWGPGTTGDGAAEHSPIPAFHDASVRKGAGGRPMAGTPAPAFRDARVVKGARGAPVP
jgi:hypothetical protein